MKYILIIVLFILFWIFAIPHQLRVKTNLLSMIIFIDFIPVLYLRKGKVFMKVAEDALLKHKIKEEDMKYIRLLKPIEKIYIKFTHISNDRFDIDIIIISLFEQMKKVIPFAFEYECKNGEDNVIIDLSLVIYIPKFIRSYATIKGEINNARKVH